MIGDVADDEGRPRGSSWHRWAAGDDPAPAAPPPPPTSAFEVVDDDADLAELLPAVPLLPAIAGQVDALDGHLKALAMRLDVIGASAAAMRTAHGERIDGYAEAAAATARRADEALEEQRRSTERSLAELRRGLDGHDELLRRLAGRVEQVATDTSATLAIARGRAEPEGSAGPVVDLAGVEARLDELADALGALAVDHVAPPPPPPVEPDDWPADDGAPAGPDLGGVEARLDELADAVQALAAAALDLDGVEQRLDDLGGRLSALEATLARMASVLDVVVDTMPASEEGTGADLVDRVAAAVVARLEGR
jgi:uncharacterized coiled-coil protein SlyX